MPGLFQGLEIGKRALLTHQLTLQTIGHNVANVNTPGYTRQRVNISSTFPEQSAVGAIGSGVQVRDVRQIRDLFLGGQFRRENKTLGQWSYKEKIMTQVEAIFNEPHDNTLSDQMNEFFSAWSSLATDNTGSTRKALVASAEQMTTGFHQLASELDNLRASIDSDMVNLTAQVNSHAAEIANLNQMIKIQEVGGQLANDLRDSRDLLLDQLSLIVDVNTVESKGTMNVYIGAMAIVDGGDSMIIEAKSENKRGVLTHKLVWDGTDTEIRSVNGQLKGLLDTRDEVIPRYMAELDKLASAMAKEVNSIHAAGYGLDGSTGINFFQGGTVTARSIKIDTEILRNNDKIAAAVESGSEEDNRTALAIADLQDGKIFYNNTATIGDYYNSMIGSLGVESRGASSFSANYGLVVSQITNARESVQGVSLDEEMANMIKFQHAYDAAARVITTMDQALDTVISGMGLVGRA